MRKIIGTIVVLIIIGSAVANANGHKSSSHGSQTIVTSATPPDPTTDTTATTDTTDTSTDPSSDPYTDTSTTDTTPAPTNLSVGQSATLTGNEGETMQVTVTGIVDPVPPTEFDSPDQGNRYVGVNMIIKNVGNVNYSDSPGNGAKLIDANNTQHDDEITSGGECDAPGSLNIAPGDQRRVCIPFQVPQGTRLSEFQMTLSSGFADDTGEWNLG